MATILVLLEYDMGLICITLANQTCRYQYLFKCNTYLLTMPVAILRISISYQISIANVAVCLPHASYNMSGLIDINVCILLRFTKSWVLTKQYKTCCLYDSVPHIIKEGINISQRTLVPLSKLETYAAIFLSVTPQIYINKICSTSNHSQCRDLPMEVDRTSVG